MIFLKGQGRVERRVVSKRPVEMNGLFPKLSFVGLSISYCTELVPFISTFGRIILVYEKLDEIYLIRY